MRTASLQSKPSNRKLQRLHNEPVKCAEAADLVYVSDHSPGITRTRRGKTFLYSFNGKRITDPDALARIKKLALPPAWTNVWICPHVHGHLQATGRDAKNRKQYKYHAQWSELRGQTKFSRLFEFGAAMKLIRAQIEKDISLPGLPLRKVLATVLSVMEQTGMRIGNAAYEKQNGSYGLTTLKDTHVKITGAKLELCFKGKSGVQQKIGIRSKRLVRIIRHCRDLPGKELFRYYDDAGKSHRIDSGMVNQYLKEITGQNFTAKDFRTWIGTTCALDKLREIIQEEEKSTTARNVIRVLDAVAEQLGNSRTICKKHYVHPVILRLYEQGKLNAYLRHCPPSVLKRYASYRDEEILLMRILERAPAMAA